MKSKILVMSLTIVMAMTIVFNVESTNAKSGRSLAMIGDSRTVMVANKGDCVNATSNSTASKALANASGVPTNRITYHAKRASTTMDGAGGHKGWFNTKTYKFNSSFTPKYKSTKFSTAKTKSRLATLNKGKNNGVIIWLGANDIIQKKPGNVNGYIKSIKKLRNTYKNLKFYVVSVATTKKVKASSYNKKLRQNFGSKLTSAGYRWPYSRIYYLSINSHISAKDNGDGVHFSQPESAKIMKIVGNFVR